ncbi:hypothetical protein KC217_22050, partial [Mycobacterium tuberculosis]|nr:hypothetical protein [Mycobacterium tuberculosis]
MPHLIDLAERALRNLDWPSATADYVARTAETPARQGIWQAPPVADDPAPLTDAERASVVRVLDQTVAALRDLKRRFPPQ